MSCQDTRAQISVMDAADFGSIRHLSECEDCRALADLAAEADRQIAEHVDAFATRVSFDVALERISENPTPTRMNMSWTLHTTAVVFAAAAAMALAILPILGNDADENAASRMWLDDHDQESWLVQVAAHDLRVGHTITDADVYAVQVSDEVVHDGLFIASSVVPGHVVTAPILANELLTCQRLSSCAGAVAGRPKQSSWKTEELLPEGSVLQLQARWDLPAGHTIRWWDLYATEIPAGLLPPGSYTDRNELIGVEVVEDIVADEPVRCERLDTSCP